MKLIKQISIIWHINDVLEVNPNLTEQQASEVLISIKENHDATIGVNWDVIEATIDYMFPTE